MNVIRSNLETYFYMALQTSREVDQRIGENFKSIQTAAIEDTLKAVQDGEQLWIVE
jgi:hypothetical protein